MLRSCIGVTKINPVFGSMVSPYRLQWDDVPAVAEPQVAIARSSSRPGMPSLEYTGRCEASVSSGHVKARCKGLPKGSRPHWSMSRHRLRGENAED